MDSASRARASALWKPAASMWLLLSWCNELSAWAMYLGRTSRWCKRPRGVPMRRAQLHFETAKRVLADLGWASAADKEVPPCRRLVNLGVDVDADTGVARLAEKKRVKYARGVDELLAAPWADALTVDKLVSKLQFATQTYPVARQHLHGLRRLRRASFRAGRAVPISGAARADLLSWARLLAHEDPEGVPLAAAQGGWTVGVDAGAVYADASGAGGFAAWTLERDTVYAVAGEWVGDEVDLRIELQELFASTVGAVAFSRAGVLPRDFVSYSDNTTAMAAMRALRSTAAPVQRLMARRTQWLHEAGHVEVSRRITSENNVWADLGSRPEKGGVLALAASVAAAGLRFVLLPVPADWRDIRQYADARD